MARKLLRKNGLYAMTGSGPGAARTGPSPATDGGDAARGLGATMPAMPREHVSFPGALGAPLVGRLESPDGGPVAYALFAHCFTCSKDLKSAGAICRELTARGIAVLRFDFTGVGESGGEFAATNFSSNVGDLVAAADFLRATRQAPALLVGHSLGGTAMLAAAPRIPEATAVATIGAPSDTAHLLHKLEPRLPGDRREIDLDLGGPRPVRISRQLLDDLAGDHLRGVMAHLDKALLLFHSPVDRVVGIDHAERLFLEARHPKSFVSLDTADHLLSEPRDAAHCGRVLAAWAGRYLAAAAGAAAAGTAAGEAGAGAAERAESAGAAERAERTGAAGPAPGEVEVSGSAGALRQEVRAGRHRFAVDEPVAEGGGDTGPTPYGLLLAALGSCTGITLRLYADRKQLPLESTRVRLRHSRVHARDCAGCEESATAKLERIDREIELHGPLSPEQQARLLAIADRCPVHRTLSSRIEIVTRQA
jgi:uncharacterized OsmC-like protein/alpha/beta superfamily hydrolase